MAVRPAALSLVLFFLLTISGPAYAQVERSTDWIWRPVLDYKGVSFTYLFYPRADNTNNGIVIKITNRNDYAIRYQFELVFLADDTSHVETVKGRLGAGEAATGSSAGLFWIPFADGRSLSHFGLREYEVEPEAELPSSQVRNGD